MAACCIRFSSCWVWQSTQGWQKKMRQNSAHSPCSKSTEAEGRVSRGSGHGRLVGVVAHVTSHLAAAARREGDVAGLHDLEAVEEEARAPQHAAAQAPVMAERLRDVADEAWLEAQEHAAEDLAACHSRRSSSRGLGQSC